MTPGEIEAWIRLSASGLSPVRQRALLEAFGGAEQVLSASDEALVGVEGLGALHVRKLRHALEAVDAAEIRERIAERGWQLVPLTSREYPERLREIADAPSVLMVEGDLGPSDALAVSVVGTRKCSDYARRLARRLSYDLAARGVTVVSGMALGVDGEAHRGAIEAGGRTVAVLGCGLDITYPPQHAELRSEIAASGAVISALPLGTAPTRDQFPRRNRIISGLSVGVVVVEAPVGSGALITAQLAAE
ncbi:MAG: DNA-processing protein DprA, partial [Armatimonadota bacterium]